MLHFIRERAQGWIAWVIVGLLIIPFALWGINEYFGNGGKLVAADVNGTEISQREFQQAFYEQRTRMQQMLGQQYDANLFDPQIKQRVINELVDRELLRQYASNNGYRVSEEAVVATIRSIEAFREDGVFSTELYQQQVQAQGQSPAAFEQRVKRIMLISQLPDGLGTTALVTEADVDAAIKLQEQKRDIRYLELPVAKYRDESVASDAAINDYYEQNAEQFMTAEKVRVEYVELAATDLASDEIPSEETLREFYQSQSGQFSVPEERQARHILIQVEEGADEDMVAASRAKAEDVLSRVKAGESFEELAKSYSDDPGSKDIGGDLGFFGKGVMEPDFEQAVFSLKEGEVSDLVLTSFGFHIIKLEAIRAAQTKSFEEVRDELLVQYQRDAAERRYFDLAEQLTNLAYETPDSLEVVAEQLGLELKTSAYFTRNGGVGIFANPRVAAAAYSDDVLKQGYNSEPIEIGENHVVVLRVQDYQRAAQRPLAEVQDQVKARLVRDAARAATKQAGEAALQQLSAGDNSDTVAQSLGVSWVDAPAIGRKAEGVDDLITRQAFRLQRPEAGSARYGGVVLSSGNYALIQLNQVTDGDPATLDKAGREALKRQLAGAAGNNAQANLIEALRADAKITIQADEL
jgi:peptidyl-prolyl cis-trans isomerase D